MTNKKSYFLTLALGFSGLLLMGFALPNCPLFGGGATDEGLDFIPDNEAVFDLFQDDFGTGTDYDDRFTVSPKQVKVTHKKGTTECPQKIGTFKFTGPELLSWEILEDLPDWLNAQSTSGRLSDALVLEFPCFGFEDGENIAEITIKTGSGIDTIGVELIVE